MLFPKREITRKIQMPRLVNLSNNNFSIFEFFPDAYWDHNRRTWNFTITDEYPYTAYVFDSTDNQHMLKNIRIHAERCGADDILYLKKNITYSYCYNKGNVSEYAEDWQRIHCSWWVFHFASEIDRTALLLKYNNKLYTEMTEFHPEYTWHTKENTRNW